MKKIGWKIKLRERLLLVYLLGGVLPMLFLEIYGYASTRATLLEQTRTAELEELSLIGESIADTMAVVENVSRQLYFDPNLEELAFTKFDNYREILESYRKKESIAEYEEIYYREISAITLYTFNPTIHETEHYGYADAGIKSQRWYIGSMNLSGAPYWYYDFDPITGKSELTMSRLIQTRDMEKVGVVRLCLQNLRTELPILARSADTLLLYDDVMVLHSNFDVNTDAVLSLMMGKSDEENSFLVTYDGESYLMTYVRIHPDYARDYYTLMSLRPYREILSSVRSASLRNLFPSILFMIFALVLISIFSNAFSRRMLKFKDRMHRAAGGDFSREDPIGGQDEIAELYQDLQSMIEDMQELMNRLVQENVQREQLNTRQREVEFKMLASQINPHFLYNTLETIRMQARVAGQSDIEELTKMLARLLRHNIQAGESLQTVEQELRFIEYYLRIQDYRFHDRITYEIRVDQEERILPMKILPLLIQPFVENAYAHALEGMEQGGRIRIHLYLEDALYIDIEDNGSGMSEEKLSEVRHLLNDFEHLDRTHIGITNVNQRIHLRYGDPYGVFLYSEEGKGTTARIKLPSENF